MASKVPESTKNLPTEKSQSSQLYLPRVFASESVKHVVLERKMSVKTIVPRLQRVILESIIFSECPWRRKSMLPACLEHPESEADRLLHLAGGTSAGVYKLCTVWQTRWKSRFQGSSRAC